MSKNVFFLASTASTYIVLNALEILQLASTVSTQSYHIVDSNTKYLLKALNYNKIWYNTLNYRYFKFDDS